MNTNQRIFLLKCRQHAALLPSHITNDPGTYSISWNPKTKKTENDINKLRKNILNLDIYEIQKSNLEKSVAIIKKDLQCLIPNNNLLNLRSPNVQSK